MEKKKQQIDMVIVNRMMLIAFAILLVTPFVSAYPVTYPGYDLYQVFVENVFGGFWISVLGLMVIMFIIMGLLGGLSAWTSMTYCGIFFLAMAIGYTQPLIVIPLWAMIMFWSVTQIIRLINVQSSLW